jgi:hypothetical protein
MKQQVYFCAMQKSIFLICLMLMHFGLSFGQSRKVYFYSEDPIFYNHIKSERLVIDSFPADGAWVNFLWQNDTLSKFIPEGTGNMKYQVTKGNRGEAGIWYRPLEAGGNQNFIPVTYIIGFVPENRRRIFTMPIEEVDTTEIILAQEEVVPQREDVISMEVQVEDTIRVVALEKVEVELAEEKMLSHEEVEFSVWEKAENADFEFDRMRILRDYLKNNGCEAEEVGRALGILKYDPSRLELLKSLSESCPEQIRPQLSVWAEKFFVYPQFRSQVIHLL